VVDWVVHHLRANSKVGSRRNIAAHYDLGNEFYAAWLDEEMVYSSAMWPNGADALPARASAADEGGLPFTLEMAQATKLDRVVELVDAERGHRVLEIGVGWGALAARLAQRVEAHVTGITLSHQQLAHVKARAVADGLAHLLEARYQDYREVLGTFDRIVSVEMIEAVGRAYWPAYFQTLYHRLSPRGHAIVQAITIDHAQLAKYAACPDFIQVHVFPGGMLPSIEAMAEEAARAGLTFACVERFGASYARTLAEWRQRFVQAWPHIEAMGFDDAFRRKWEYYLGYCEGGFRAGAIDVGLYRMARAGA
jgi:cyclopropane-fatty-acyl-phospholipid synthase